MCHSGSVSDFFLGSTTPTGFGGYFESLAAQEGLSTYLIKSGPGCGKSTFMKRLCQQSGTSVQRIHCSSDPDSLDGVILPKKQCAVIDATAPHTIDPEAPGAVEEVISLYHTLDTEKLQKDRCQIVRLFRQCSTQQAQAARCVESAAGLLKDARRLVACQTDFEKVTRLARRLSKAWLPQGQGVCKESWRLLSAVTPKGILFYEGSIEALSKNRIIVHDEYGAAAAALMDILLNEARRKGQSVIVCPCAVFGQEKIEHLLFPQLSLAFLTSNRWHSTALTAQRTIHCKRFYEGAPERTHRAQLRFDLKAATELFAQANEHQRRAKTHHDELERFYTAAVDFAKVDEACSLFKDKIAAL